jgi:phenylalanyl-tRNA synthetase alpha subunit
MDLIKQYSKRPDNTVNKQDNTVNKKEHPAIAEGRERDRKILSDILNVTKSIFNRQSYIKKDTENILRSLNNFSSLNIPCQVPSMTPKQLYLCYKGGWTIRQLSGLSGLDEMVVQTKIENYRQNNT